MHSKQSQIQLGSLSTVRRCRKEVPVMRYIRWRLSHARGFCHYLSDDRWSKKPEYGIQHSYRFMVSNTIQKVSGRQMESRPSKIFVKLVKEQEDETVLAKVKTDLTSAELVAAMEEVVAGRASSTGDGPSSRSQNERRNGWRERTAIAKVMQACAVAIPTEVQGQWTIVELGWSFV